MLASAGSAGTMTALYFSQTPPQEIIKVEELRNDLGKFERILNILAPDLSEYAPEETKGLVQNMRETSLFNNYHNASKLIKQEITELEKDSEINEFYSKKNMYVKGQTIGYSASALFGVLTTGLFFANRRRNIKPEDKPNYLKEKKLKNNSFSLINEV